MIVMFVEIVLHNFSISKQASLSKLLNALIGFIFLFL